MTLVTLRGRQRRNGELRNECRMIYDVSDTFSCNIWMKISQKSNGRGDAKPIVVQISTSNPYLWRIYIYGSSGEWGDQVKNSLWAHESLFDIISTSMVLSGSCFTRRCILCALKQLTLTYLTTVNWSDSSASKEKAAEPASISPVTVNEQKHRPLSSLFVQKHCSRVTDLQHILLIKKACLLSVDLPSNHQHHV